MVGRLVVRFMVGIAQAAGTDDGTGRCVQTAW
jgi:hypothetical protein